MKYLTIIASVFMMSAIGNSQKHLEHIHTSITSTYGGMEDGGISSTHIYQFVTRSKIKLQNVIFDDQLLDLKKGDTLEFIIHIYTRYNQHQLQLEHSNDTTDTIITPLPPFKSGKYSGIYMVNANDAIDWEVALKYGIRSRIYTTELKEIPVEVRNYFAP